VALVAPRTEQAAASGSGAEARARIEKRLISALAERTGYPEEMLELDVDLEGDLGIDTVKQVEVFSRVRNELGLEAARGVSMRDFSTLRKVVDHLVTRLASGSGDAPPAAPAFAKRPSRRPLRPGADERRAAPSSAPSPKPAAVPRPSTARSGSAPGAAPEARPKRRSLPPAVPASPIRLAASDRLARPATSAADRERCPALDHVLERSPDRVVAARTFSLARDRWLRGSLLDHRHFVPAGIAWELLAEAASLLAAPGTAIRGAQDLVARGPLHVDEEEGSCEVRVEAERTEGGLVRARLVAAHDGADSVFHEGTFRLGGSSTHDAPPEVLAALDRRGHSRNAHQLAGARDPLHLGETLAGCVWARSASFREMLGGIEVDPAALASLASSELATDVERDEPPQFVLEPAVLESAFSLAGFAWFALTGLAGLPEGLDRLELGRSPRPGEEMPCLVRLRGTTPSTVTADVTVLGDDRTLIAKLRGARLVCLERLAATEDREEQVSLRRFFRAVQRPSEPPPR
jgi:hypothetical protein